MAKRRTRVRTWAKRDPNDERKIHWTFTTWNGKTIKATSEQEYAEINRTENILLNPNRLGEAWIKSINLVNNEWHIVCYED